MKRTESNTISRTLLCGFPHLKGISSHKIQFSIIFPQFIFFRSFVLYSLQFVLILLLYFFSLFSHSFVWRVLKFPNCTASEYISTFRMKLPIYILVALVILFPGYILFLENLPPPTDFLLFKKMLCAYFRYYMFLWLFVKKKGKIINLLSAFSFWFIFNVLF